MNDTKTILFPCDYFNNKAVDPDLKQEYEAALQTGLFNVILFDYDRYLESGKLTISPLPDEPIKAAYRGWMLKPDKYKEFYGLLQERNITLITPPQEYEFFHIFPNVYPYLKADTAKMIVFDSPKDIDLNVAQKEFKRFMVKDFVKSVKGTSFPKYFDSSITEAEFNESMKLFMEYRGDLYTGGICFKEYLDLKRYDGKTNEYRMFYVNHEVATVSRNSGQADYAPVPPTALIEKYRDLNSIYYTIDYAEIADGSRRILEAGDGQVSGLSDGQDYNAYFRALYHCINR